MSGGELAGYVQSTVLPSGIAYVAYELNSKFWRLGIGSSAVEAMIRELREQYNVTGFVAVLMALNYRSLGLLKKLGFSFASEEQAAVYRDEENEIVLVKNANAITRAA